MDEVKRYYRLDSDEETKHAAPEKQDGLEDVIIENKKEDTVSTSLSSEELSEIDEAEERWARIRYVKNKEKFTEILILVNVSMATTFSF